jgi:hypothetical protein
MSELRPELVRELAQEATLAVGLLVEKWAEDDLHDIHRKRLDEMTQRYLDDLDGLIGAVAANRNGD